MPDAPPPILTPWLYFLALLAVSSVGLTAVLVWASHSLLGEMRPMNGYFVMGVASLAGLVTLLIAGRYVVRAARRIRG